VEKQQQMALRLIAECCAAKPIGDGERVRRIKSILYYLDEGVLSEQWWGAPDSRGWRPAKTRAERDVIWDSIGSV
jgi:hypothetical protein